MDFKGKDIISIPDLSKEEIDHVLEQALKLKKKPNPNLLKNHVMASLFFEPSTRTRLSFETAAERLGMEIIGFAEAGVSSTAKGESLHDSIKNIGLYADVIAMRHPAEGSARLASEATDKPVLNGGDGSNQHPTQTLLDLFTIKETQKKLTGLNIALVGDLKYGRTTHSLAQALTHYKPNLYLVAPEVLQMPAHIQAYLKEKGVKFVKRDKIESVIKKMDIVYMTRIQKERFADPLEYERVRHVYVLREEMLEGVKPNLKIMHPLPRVDEIEVKVDKTKYAYYFQQAQNGLYVRQALLGLVLGKIK